MSDIKIGILGGGGPLASASFHHKLVSMLHLSGAIEDHEYPEIVHISKNFGALDIEGYHDFNLINMEYRDVLNILTALGCTHPLLIPCNSICHTLSKVHLNGFYNIIDITVEQLSNILKTLSFSKQDLIRIKVLCSPYLIQESAYAIKILNNLSNYNLKIIYENEKFMAQLISCFLTHTNYEAGLKLLKTSIESDCDIAILGCTELSLGISDIKTNAITIDSMDSLISYFLRKINI